MGPPLNFRIALFALALAAPLAIHHVALGAEPSDTTSLFNGQDLDGWVTATGKPVTRGWEAVDGTLHRSQGGGDIFYHQPLGNFRLSFAWKVAPGGNSGVKYRVRKYGNLWLGPEYQIYDDGQQQPNKHSAASLYALQAPNETRQLNPPGEWNTSQIVVQGRYLEHWLNGELVIAADLCSYDWQQRLADSKFAPYPDFAQNTTGRLMLQDHGTEVWYRDLEVTLLEEVIPRRKRLRRFRRR